MIHTTHTEPDEQARCKASVKARLLDRPELCPRIGRFELIALLGKGGTGLVYAARDTTSGANVALKLLRCVDPRAVLLFKREFGALAELAHENIVEPRELFEEGDTCYFTMELVCGAPFTQHACKRDWDSRRSTLRQLFRVVQFIHSAGHVHCDLKPSNVLITAEGRVVVLDFSLVSPTFGARSDRVSSGSGPRGTPPYMAPELLAGDRHSPQSDAYALGVMLAQALLTDRTAPAEIRAICASLSAVDPTKRMSLDAARARLGEARRCQRRSREYLTV